MQLIFKRYFKKHAWDSIPSSTGRSVCVVGISVLSAYKRLKDILQESNFREVVKRQERFERPCDIRRRKKREREWKTFMTHVKDKVNLALKKKSWDSKEDLVDRWISKRK